MLKIKKNTVKFLKLTYVMVETPYSSLFKVTDDRSASITIK